MSGKWRLARLVRADGGVLSFIKTRMDRLIFLYLSMSSTKILTCRLP